MPLTRSFRETVQAWARRGIEFRQALLGQAIQGLPDGNLEEGRAARSPGEHEVSRKTIARECRVISGDRGDHARVLYLISLARLRVHWGTRRSLRPLFSGGQRVRANLGRIAPR